MSNKVYLEWEIVNQNWEDVDQFWEEVILIQEVARTIGSSGALSEYVRNNPWKRLREKIGEEKTKKFIKILARVNGLEYDEILDTSSTIKITADHFRKVFEQNEKVGVKITFEK